MDLKINVVDHRSSSPGFPFTSLSVVASVSTLSLGSWLLLGDSPAYSYSATTAVDDCLQTATTAFIEQKSNNQSAPSIASESNRSVPADSSSAVALVDEFELIQEASLEANTGWIEYQSIDASELEQQAQLNSSEIDLVAAFDAATAQIENQSEEPLIEISIDVPDDAKDVEDNAVALEPEPDLAQAPESTTESVEASPSQQADDLGEPLVTAQGVYLLQGDESSARARLSGSYALTPNVLLGATLDLTTGDAFTNSPEEGFDLNELYVTVSPPTVPSLRLTLGMIDLTSYFDRNSFAKDAATHFFNPVFQTNPALAAAGIGSRPGVLVNWDVTDQVSLRGAAFSSDRDLDEFAFDAAAAEVAVRLGNFIVRGTYVTDRDAGQDSGFNEIFAFRRGDDEFGLESDDREIAYGVNAEYFIPEINLGLFARYGRYENQALDRGGNTYSFGVNALDLFFADDRLGLAYGRELSNESLRRDRDEDVPDVLELFYDVRLTRNFRVGASLQQRDSFSETVAGLRVQADFNLSELWR